MIPLKINAFYKSLLRMRERERERERENFWKFILNLDNILYVLKKILIIEGVFRKKSRKIKNRERQLKNGIQIDLEISHLLHWCIRKKYLEKS